MLWVQRNTAASKTAKPTRVSPHSKKIAQALGVTLAELFADNEQLTAEVNLTDKTLMEKVKLMESLEEKEKRTLFTILNAFVSKKRLKDALSDAIKLM